MQGTRNTKDQLVKELEALRARLVELEGKRIASGQRESDEQLHVLMDHLQVPIQGYRSDGIVTYWNQASERLYGYTAEEAVGRKLEDLIIPPSMQPHFREALQASKAQTESGEFCPADEIELLRKDGSLVPVYSTHTAIYRPGQPIKLFCIDVNLSERKRVEDELNRARRDWENIFQAIGHPAVILDKHHTILEVNRATAKATGQTAQALIGKKCYEIFHGSSEAPKRCPLDALLAAGRLETIEMEMEAFNGIFLVSCTPILDEQGRLQKIIHIATDVTDRKQAEEALRRERDFNKRLIQASPAFIVSISPTGQTLMMNNAMLQAIGYTSDEVEGKDYLTTFVPQADREKLGDIFSRLISQQEPTINENRVIAKDGRELLVQWHGRQVLDESGQIEYFFGVGIDITDRKRAEEALRMAEVGKLASGLVHEVRNPLNAMRMQIAVIQHKLEHPDQQSVNLALTQLEHLEHEVLRVQKLANDFLAYGRPASDHPEIIELPKTISDVAEFIKPEFEQSGVRVDVVLEESLGKLAVQMDLSKLRQVLLNLAENARQATACGGQLRLSCDKPSPHEARIQVYDTGPGIAPHHLPYIFDAFYSTKDEGTGLGLAIVKRTIEAAGGRVQIKSEVDCGTCFELYLPLAGEGSSTPADASTAN